MHRRFGAMYHLQVIWDYCGFPDKIVRAARPGHWAEKCPDENCRSRLTASIALWFPRRKLSGQACTPLRFVCSTTAEWPGHWAERSGAESKCPDENCRGRLALHFVTCAQPPLSGPVIERSVAESKCPDENCRDGHCSLHRALVSTALRFAAGAQPPRGGHTIARVSTALHFVTCAQPPRGGHTIARVSTALHFVTCAQPPRGGRSAQKKPRCRSGLFPWVSGL